MDSLDLLTGYDEFSRILKEYKQKGEKLFSNSLLPGKTVREALLAGNVYIHRQENGFLVLTEEGEAYPMKCCYFLPTGTAFLDAAKDRSILIEEPDMDGRREIWLRTFIPSLKQAGYELVADNVQVSCDLDPEDLEAMVRVCGARLEKEGYRLEPGAAGSAAEIRQLWSSWLKPTDIPPEHWELREDERTHLVRAFDRSGALCGVNWWQEQDGTCEIRHTVTAPSCKRKGIGTAIVLYAMHRASQAGCRRAFTYIDKENTNSLGLYGKLGFTPNGRSSRQFLRPALC